LHGGPQCGSDQASLKGKLQILLGGQKPGYESRQGLEEGPREGTSRQIDGILGHKLEEEEDGARGVEWGVAGAEGYHVLIAIRHCGSPAGGGKKITGRGIGTMK